MKRNWLGLALSAVLACGASAWAATLASDNAGNYSDETPLADGANEGYGFGAWECPDAAPVLESSASGACGDIDSEENFASFRIARDDANDYGHVYRSFNELVPGNPGNVLSLKFTCAWDGGGRGIDLYAGDTKIANAVNLGPGNKLTVNGETISEEYAGAAVYELFLHQNINGIDVGVSRKAPGTEDLVYETKIVTDKALSRIGFYAGGWEWNDGADVNNYALFVNDLQITGEAALDALSLSGPWAVTEANTDLEFTVIRTGDEGDLEVALSSSWDEFVSVPETVTIEDGETSATFQVKAALQGGGNEATITASAEGMIPAEYGLKGPTYACNANDDQWQFGVGTNCTFWVNNWQSSWFPGDDSLVTVQSTDESVVTVAPLDDWKTDEGDPDVDGDEHTYASWTVTTVGAGLASVEVLYDGVKVGSWGFEVIEPSILIVGPTTIRVGQSATYTVQTSLLEDGVVILTADSALVEISPDDWEDVDAGGDVETEFTVTAGDETGSVTLTATDGAGLTATLDVVIEEAPDYSDYIAYDDGSFYDAGALDFAATGVGIDGFGPWGIYKDSAEFGGAFVGDDDGGFPEILTDGQTMAIYANGSNPDYAVVRPFVNDLQPGQKASLEFVAPQEGGSRYVQFARIWEGVPYNRFEVWASGGKIGVNVQDGEGHELNWSENARRVVVSVMRAADGTDYTLSISGYNEGSEFVDDTYQYSIDSDVGSWGDGIQGIVVGGYDLPSDFLFNRLAIQQVEEPVVARSIGWAAGVWNPDAAGEYGFAISATADDIGEVLLSVEPSDGALSLSTDRVDLTGVTEAAFTATLSEANEGDSFVIKATPADTTVEPIEYNVTVSGNYVTISCDAWEYPVSAGEIWLGLSASVSKYGTYAITSSAEAVLAVPEASEAIAVGSPDPSWFNVTIVGPGTATIYATAEGEETPAAEYTFTVIADAPVIDGTTIEVSFADGDGLSGKVDDTLRDQFLNVRAQVMQWNGVDAFDEVEVLENEAEWPDMQFTPSIDNPVIRLIFEKK